MKKALVTGITGQDGSYLAELLLAKGYEVHGVVRRVSTFNRQRIDAFRDGPAGDRLRGDFVVATGETHTVREFCERSFACAGIPLAWEGEGVDETGRCTKTGKTLVRVDPRYFRPAEVELLLGDPAKAKKLLGWEPTVTFEGLVEMMTKADLALAAREAGTTEQAPRAASQAPADCRT